MPTKCATTVFTASAIEGMTSGGASVRTPVGETRCVSPADCPRRRQPLWATPGPVDETPGKLSPDPDRARNRGSGRTHFRHTIIAEEGDSHGAQDRHVGLCRDSGRVPRR